MLVQCWRVGAAAPSDLPMTLNHICGHLTVDWIPSLPATVSSSFVGWPPYLIEPLHIGGSEFLSLREEAGRSDRQWKGVLSWMLGIAGTRHFLDSEGYCWVAPLSAFYPNATGSVDLTGWNVPFPPSSLVAYRAPGARSRLRPDYIAVRPGSPPESDSYEWAVAESKGTCRSLANLTLCPTDWYNQVRNVHLELNGAPLTIQRHLVVATRVNTAATNLQTRQLQLRAWNSEEEPERTALPVGAAVNVAAAHLFGFFKTLHLRENARALALATQMRTLARHSSIGPMGTPDLERAVVRADEELRERTQRRSREDRDGALTLSSRLTSAQSESRFLPLRQLSHANCRVPEATTLQRRRFAKPIVS